VDRCAPTHIRFQFTFRAERCQTFRCRGRPELRRGTRTSGSRRGPLSYGVVKKSPDRRNRLSHRIGSPCDAMCGQTVSSVNSVSQSISSRLLTFAARKQFRGRGRSLRREASLPPGDPRRQRDRCYAQRQRPSLGRSPRGCPGILPRSSGPGPDGWAPNSSSTG